MAEAPLSLVLPFNLKRGVMLYSMPTRLPPPFPMPTS